MMPANTNERKSKLFYLLLCGCIVIWGYVIHEVVQSLSQNEDTFVLPTVTASTEPEAAPLRLHTSASYNKEARDPFQRPGSLFLPPERPAQPEEVDIPEPVPPPLRLLGVVDDTALLEGVDGSTFVVRAGEQAGLTKLVKVSQNAAVVRYEGHTFTLDLKQ